MATYKGQNIPPLVALWLDQLMGPETLPHLELASAGRYIDLVLTAGPNAKFAKPPQLLLK